MAGRQRVGFGRGFLAPFAGAKQLLVTPATWPFALVPVVVFVMLETGVVLASWRHLKPWVNDHLAGGGSLRNAGAWLASFLAVVFIAGLGWLLSAALTPVLSAPALERIVGSVERELKAPERAPLGFFAELGCGLRATLLSLGVTLPAILALSVLELVAPPIVVVTTPLKLLLGALGVAWSLFDYPLTLRGVGINQRLHFVTQHFWAVLGFGVAFSLVFWVPCFSVVMLPVGVAGATRLYWEIERASRSLP